MRIRPANNKMQLTRSGHSRWRPSQLILVFYAPRQGRAGDVTRVASTATYVDRIYVPQTDDGFALHTLASL